MMYHSEETYKSSEPDCQALVFSLLNSILDFIFIMYVHAKTYISLKYSLEVKNNATKDSIML